MKMAQCAYSLVFVLLALSPLAVANKNPNKWNILNARNLNYTLKNYCESWRMNVELDNLRDFSVVPQECVWHIGNYMTSTQYKVDQEGAVDQALLHLNTIQLAGDGKDAWIFDLDDTLLSTVPYFKYHSFGGEVIDRVSMEMWMEEMIAPAVEAILPLYNKVRMADVCIFIITARDESLRNATAQNLVKAGFTGWTKLIMRDDCDDAKSIVGFKTEKRMGLVNEGYRILGNVGDQWSDLMGSATGVRTLKLPNPMYYS